MKTRECRECHRAWVSVSGHAKHAYRELTLRGWRAFRCPGVPAMQFTPSIKQQTLDEVRRIRQLLEEKKPRCRRHAWVPTPYQPEGGSYGEIRCLRCNALYDAEKRT